MTRVAGQFTAFPAAVAADGLIITSGIIDHRALGAHEAPPIESQLTSALDTLSTVLVQAGGSLETVMRVECFLTDSADAPYWNEAFARTWPRDPPARTTLVATLLHSTLKVEIQAIAHLTECLTTRPADEMGQ
ncbi:RidA family protein [Rhodococcus qingshengii]|uniref:RidA family protein n=1 Tax=Rhodococcus qingshengii TaxID=334542 RepID=UPI0010A6088D|nr:RidA family protein [Rhodococcus qingshengii]THJ64941.1 RidA family protein [Rhodococcus qingshengii]